MSEGRKDDAGKLRWGLLRKSLVVPLEEVIRVLMGGAQKYGDENWQLVENPEQRYRDALDRHLADLDKGILIDKDSGCHNYAHVATNALFLLWFATVGGRKSTADETPVTKPVIRWRDHKSDLRPVASAGLLRVYIEHSNGIRSIANPVTAHWSQVKRWAILPGDPHGEAGR